MNKFLRWFYVLFALYILANAVGLVYNLHHRLWDKTVHVIREDRLH